MRFSTQPEPSLDGALCAHISVLNINNITPKRRNEQIITNLNRIIMPSPLPNKIGESGETITHDNSMGIAEDKIHDGRTSFTVMHRGQDALCERLAILQPFQDVSTTTTYI